MADPLLVWSLERFRNVHFPPGADIGVAPSRTSDAPLGLVCGILI
jgi:hypothetical protein